MTKHLLKITSLVFCSLGSAIAQPILTASGINPVIGDVIEVNQSQYMSPGNGGASQTWNFAAMTSSTSSNNTCQAVSAAPNPGPFTSSSNMQMNDGTSYSFINAGSSALAITGLDIPSGPITMAYSNSEEIMHYPFNMGNTYNDTWYTTYTVSSFSFTRSGTTNVTYDGYGTITTPKGTFNNTARVHIVQTYSDVSQFGTTNTTNDQYLWFANGYHSSLASVFSLTTGTMTQQGGSYLTATPGSTSTTGFSDNTISNLVQSFPNPAINKVSFMSNQYPVTKVELFDLNGKLILLEENQSGSAIFSVDVSSLSTGVYMSKIYGNTGLIETKKVSIQK